MWAQRTVQTSGFPRQLAIEAVVQAALLEDLAQGDVTTDAFPQLTVLRQQGLFRVRQDCVVSGLWVAAAVCQQVDPLLVFEALVKDGDWVLAGTEIARVEGPMASMLKAERTALNFLQHLSGIATETRRFVTAVSGTGTRITHTRKTTPGLRFLEQQAVLQGGGVPHRFNLGSCVMLKDNHLQALGQIHPDEAIAVAVKTLRAAVSHTTKIEVEADTLVQVRQAVEAGADIILLDNMSPETIREALAIIQQRAIAEASGGITLETIRTYAETGVDVISTSKITLGVPAIDVGLDLA